MSALIAATENPIQNRAEGHGEEANKSAPQGHACLTGKRSPDKGDQTQEHPDDQTYEPVHHEAHFECRTGTNSLRAAMCDLRNELGLGCYQNAQLRTNEVSCRAEKRHLS